MFCNFKGLRPWRVQGCRQEGLQAAGSKVAGCRVQVARGVAGCKTACCKAAGCKVQAAGGQAWARTSHTAAGPSVGTHSAHSGRAREEEKMLHCCFVATTNRYTLRAPAPAASKT